VPAPIIEAKAPGNAGWIARELFTGRIALCTVSCKKATPTLQSFDHSIEARRENTMNQQDRFEYQHADTTMSALTIGGLAVVILTVLAHIA